MIYDNNLKEIFFGSCYIHRNGQVQLFALGNTLTPNFDMSKRIYGRVEDLQHCHQLVGYKSEKHRDTEWVEMKHNQFPTLDKSCHK